MASPAAAAETSAPAVPPVPADFQYPARYVDLPAGRMRVVDAGPASPRGTLLFVHGTPTWSYEWRHLLGAFSRDFRCVAPDHLGFGFSDRPRDFPYTPEAHSRNLLALVRALDLRDITMVLHDYGGPIGIPVALEEPGRVTRLAVLNSWMWSLEGDRDVEKAARLAGGAFGRVLYKYADLDFNVIVPYAYGDRRKLTPAILRAYRGRFPDAWSRGAVLWPLAAALLGSSEHYRGLWDRRAALAGLPSLVLWGMKDRVLPPRLLDRWREALPRAEIAGLEGSGHWPHEEEPEAVIAALRTFLGGR